MTDDVDPDELSDPNDFAGLRVVITGRLEHHKEGESRGFVNGLGATGRKRSPGRPTSLLSGES